VVGWYELFTGVIYQHRTKQTKRLWNTLGEQYKVGVYLVPYTFPAKEVNGWMLSGYPAGDMTRVYHPHDLRDKVKIPSDIVDYEGSVKPYTRMVKVNNGVLCNQLLTLLQLNTMYPVDVLFAQFSFPDHVQHLLGWEPHRKHYETMHRYILEKVNYVAKLLYDTTQPEYMALCSDHGSPCTLNHDPDGVAYYMDSTLGREVPLRSIDFTPVLMEMMN
jgi:predicted AlkP superfamily phosphohydrolase/phosphomutase